jgi:DNA repair ATPase RecN
MPAAPPKPDYAALAAGLKQITTEIERIPNERAPAGEQIEELSRLIRNLTVKVDDVKTTLNGLRADVNNLTAE